MLVLSASGVAVISSATPASSRFAVYRTVNVTEFDNRKRKLFISEKKQYRVVYAASPTHCFIIEKAALRVAACFTHRRSCAVKLAAFLRFSVRVFASMYCSRPNAI